MERKPIIIAVLLAVITLVIFNIKAGREGYQDTREISGYEYTKLHTTVNFDAEIADTISEELKHDKITFSDYNKILYQAEKARQRREKQSAGFPDVAKLLTSRSLHP
jgi:cell division protein FtsX